MRIRPATPADSAVIGHIQLASWHTMFPDAEINAAEYLAQFSDQERGQDWTDLLTAPGAHTAYVAETDAGQVVGFALGVLDHVAAPYQSELLAIHVLPASRNQGIGKRLFVAVASQFRVHGCSSLWLWVLAGNRNARHFYEQLGGQFVTEKRGIVGKNEVAIEIVEAAYGWPDIDKLIGHLTESVFPK